jgi:hypothetical protein
MNHLTPLKLIAAMRLAATETLDWIGISTGFFLAF